MTTENLNIRLEDDLTSQLTVNKNLAQEIIVTNTDKVKIILNDHHKIIKRKIEWINPVGIFISIIATLLTAQFNENIFGIDAIMWKSIFIICGLIAFVYSAYLIVCAVKYSKRGSIEEFIDKLKNQSQGIRETVAPKSVNSTIIIVHSAKYGTDTKYNDIEERLLKMMLEKNYTVIATNKLWDDPAIGEPKSLKLDISVDDLRRNIVIPENGKANLRDYFCKRQITMYIFSQSGMYYN